jgi:hypothetical protein
VQGVTKGLWKKAPQPSSYGVSASSGKPKAAAASKARSSQKPANS